MKIKKELWILTLIGVLVGFFIVRLLDAQHPQLGISSMLSPQSLDQYLEGRSLVKIEQYIKDAKILEEERDTLLEEIRALEEIIDQYEKEAAERIHRGEQIREELQKSRMVANMIDVEGPGIEIILDDRKRDSILDSDPDMLGYYIVHDSDLLEVVNELRAAGAEAIAINGVRIIGTSRISCGGPTINVGKEQRFTPPFIIHAVGDPEALFSYFQREDSIYQTLMFWGLRFEIKKKDLIQIPRFIGDVEYKYAKPIEEGE
ncbi:MAG: DUF881 domain-containing protein [Caldicoprobacterales bacterium]|mgnify:CR=1 FL=1|jgi:uncharacterized protein YlxW (UPF0749 family)|nr:DUF881 domain-containing protein [Clostridiales bacterium]